MSRAHRIYNHFFQIFNMNQHAQHCFLLDGKTILPIDHHLIDEKLKAINNNNNKHCQVDEEDFSSIQSMTKLYIPSRKIAIPNRTNCKHHRLNTHMNSNKDNTETCKLIRLINHFSS